MADIELVIKIPEEMYKNIQSENFWLNSGLTLSNAYDFIKNGIPLPKGHGDLKDADKLKHAFISWSMAVRGFFTDADIASIVYNSPTIIEADKESEEV